MHRIENRIVYILRSAANPSRHYVGITNDIRERLEWHNHGPSGHTVRIRAPGKSDAPVNCASLAASWS